jgi:hypothetical protein
MSNPNGAIQAISSAAATTLAIGVAFLGFWGFGAYSGKQAWECQHLWVLIPGALSYGLLAYVPFIATSAVKEEDALVRARYCYGAGISLLLLAISVSFAT